MYTRDSAEYWIQAELEFDPRADTVKAYKESSERVLDLMKRRWFTYCHLTRHDALETLKGLPIHVLYTFFRWVLHERRGAINSKSTVQTYWNALCLVREQELGCLPVDKILRRQMDAARQPLLNVCEEAELINAQVRQRLGSEFGLATEKREKPIMRAEDEFELLKTLWVSNSLNLAHERLRLQLALIMQLAGITGSRPGALLALKYKHLKITVLPVPDDSERSPLLIEIHFQETKTYLGEKESNTIGIPSIPLEPCLLLCPHTTLLALAFADHAFGAPGLTSAKDIFGLRVTPGSGQLHIPWKESMEEVPLFRRIERVVEGTTISSMQTLTDATLRAQLRKLGEETGMEAPVTPYTFRRGAGEAQDQSSFISEAQRNLILKHADSRTFTKHYASRYITGDTQAAYRGLQPQTQVMKMASGMSRTIDVRRPTKLSAKDQKRIGQYPEVKLHARRMSRLEEQMRQRYGGVRRARSTLEYEAYRRVQGEHRKARRRCEKLHLKLVKMQFRKEQPLIDIQNQLNGIKIEPAKESQSTQSYPFAERRNVIDALFTFAPTSTENEHRQRSDAVDAMRSLAVLQEGRARPGNKGKTATGSTAAAAERNTVGGQKMLESLECLPTQCIFCLGNDGLPAQRRFLEYYSKFDLKKHWMRKHLRYLGDAQTIECPHPTCSAHLKHKSHIRSHAESVHKTPT